MSFVFFQVFQVISQFFEFFNFTDDDGEKWLVGLRLAAPQAKSSPIDCSKYFPPQFRKCSALRFISPPKSSIHPTDADGEETSLIRRQQERNK